MQILSTVLSGLLVAGSLLQAQEVRLVDAAFLHGLRAEAARNHPAARSAGLAATAAALDIRAVRLWDDPMVGLSFMAAEKEMRKDDGDIRLSFELPLPKRGLYTANLQKAEAIRRAEIENARGSSLEVGSAAARDAIELALADETILLQAAQLRWLGSMAENARQLAINPAATGVDALRLESEFARENEVLAAARRTRDSLAGSLNLRLGRPLASPWPLLRLAAGPAPIPVATAEIARISKHNPRVRSMREMASSATAETIIAHRERQPQLSLAADANFYSGGTFRELGIGVRMSLPYFNRASYDAKVQSSQVREKAAVSDIETVRLEVAARVLAAVAEAANAAAQARAYAGEIYERSLQATQAVEDAWISSKSSLTDLLDSNRQVFAVRLEQRRLIALQRVALEELELLVPDPR